LVQRWGDPVEVIRQGDVVWIPPGQKHWHGAAPDSAMTHIAIVEHLDGRSTEWMEKVGDEQYGSSTPEPKDSAENSEAQSRAQMLFGDISPKFAELTDEVLYADVWERPELSKRDRSLITVAALVAMNRPQQLESHLRMAVENGVTKEELIETHPFCQQTETQKFLVENKVQIESWGPFAEGRNDLFKNRILFICCKPTWKERRPGRSALADTARAGRHSKICS